MQTAREWRWPPSLMFGVKPNRAAGLITKLDVVLADALRLHEDGLCPDCGMPARWVWDFRNERYFMVDEKSPVCVACGLRESLRQDPDYKPTPGEKLRFVNLLTEGGSGG